jgi:16S rRNA (guanine966-N2)-methyltransferase
MAVRASLPRTTGRIFLATDAFRRRAFPMRITGGLARGIPLKAPPGDATRPATDKLRLAVFSSLGERVAGCFFADLFAGTGSYGLESLSRGATGGVFVERNRTASRLITENLAAVRKSARLQEEVGRVITADVLSGWAESTGAEGKCRLIFIDPPYADIPVLWSRLFALSARLLEPSEDARVVFELPADMHLPAPSGFVETRRLNAGGGQPTASFWRREIPAAS